MATVAEAYFGLRDYESARAWLGRARELAEGGKVSDWAFESTARQLADIARLQSGAPLAELEKTEGWRVLREFLTFGGREYAAALRTAFVGKVGLALSGGGFRASLFHIGVLAKLAELDALRGVEVLSCVSGGSIVGAHYYLEVRHLLQTKADDEITREDYIAIVRRIERDFLNGVQRNLRTRVAAEILTNLKTVFKRNYTRTERVGELFEKVLYSKVEDGGGHAERWLDELRVSPKGEPHGFYPKRDNWRRAAKVPVLILNATTLNTGHTWQFTAAWMGEPAASINTEIDGNLQLRGMRYEDAPEGYRRFRLGRAVAASASLPGIFDPIVLDDLYPEMTVRLVDGGVHDNQGIAGLLEQECTVLLVSDASGQMETEQNPSAGLLAVPMRSLDMVMARVREEQYKDLKTRRASSLLRGLMFIHLKKDLDVDPLDWVGCPDPFDADDESRAVGPRGPLTDYGVRKDVQKLLAAIRTDLDAFSDTEAYALMTSGYLMTEREFGECVEDIGERPRDRSPWRFLALEEPMKKIGESEMMHLLEVARSRMLRERIWDYLKYLYFAAFLLLVVLPLGVGALVYSSRDDLWLAVFVFVFWALILVALLVVFGGLFLVLPLLVVTLGVKLLHRNKTVGQIVSGLLLALFGWLPARFQLHVLDKIYLRLGNIKDRPASTSADASAGPQGAAVTPAKAPSPNTAHAKAAESLDNAIDHKNTVEALGALFKAGGYEVKSFPREYEINPLQVNLDLYAFKDGRAVLAMVERGGESKSPAAWQTASSLETAALILSENLREAAGDAAARGGVVVPVLVFVDAQPDASLDPFLKRGSVKVLTMSTDDIRAVRAKMVASAAAGDGSAPQHDAELLAEAARWLGGIEEFSGPAADAPFTTRATEVTK
jgi:predicted acylesterase/phospholipase RssA